MKKIFIALMAMVALASCGKSDDNEGAIQEGAFPKKITVTYPKNNESTVLVYNIQNDKILSFTKTEYSNGVQTGTTENTKIEYNGNLIKQIKSGEPSSEDYSIIDYHYNGQGRLVRQTIVEPNDDDAKTETYEYSYMGDQLSKEIHIYPSTTYINGQEKKINRHNEKVLEYNGNIITVNEISTSRDGNGNVVSGTSTHTNTIVYTLSNGNLVKKVENQITTEYLYDTNTNPMPLNKLRKTTDPIYFLSPDMSKNNLIKTEKTYIGYQGVEVKTIITQDLTYNEKGYPTMNKKYRQEGNNPKELSSITEYEY